MLKTYKKKVYYDTSIFKNTVLPKLTVKTSTNLRVNYLLNCKKFWKTMINVVNFSFKILEIDNNRYVIN